MTDSPQRLPPETELAGRLFTWAHRDDLPQNVRFDMKLAYEALRGTAGHAQTGQQQIKDAFYAGYWAWFGPATKQELDRGCSELDESWLEYEATLTDTSTPQPKADWNYIPKPGQLSGPSTKD